MFQASNLIIIVMASSVQLLVGLLVGWFVRGARQQTPSISDVYARRATESLLELQSLAALISRNAAHHQQQIDVLGKDLAAVRELGDEASHTALEDSLERMAAVNEQLKRELFKAEDRLQQQSQQIQTHIAEARTDALTGLSNRRAFDDELRRRLVQYQRKQTPLSLMLVDVDHFKKFNDAHGHQAGDEVLRGVARVLYNSMREMDIVARYGGEEFAVILPDTDLEDALEAAERARSAVAGTSFDVDGASLRVTISGGVTQALPGDNDGSLLKRADEALYASKSAGRNRAFVHLGDVCAPVSPTHDAADAAAAATPVGRAGDRPRRPGAVAAALPPHEPGHDHTSIAAPCQPSPDDPAPPDHAASAAELEYHDRRIEVEPLEVDPRTDELTRLPSRSALLEDLARRMAQRRRFNTPVSLVLADVDALRSINLAHGRDVGDIVLRAVTQFLNTAMREMDMVARFSGDQFALMLPGTTLENGVRAAERIRNAISLCKLRVDSVEIQFTISTGIAEVVPDDDPDSFLLRAVTALNTAQSAGGNCSFFHTGAGCEPAEVVLAQHAG